MGISSYGKAVFVLAVIIAANSPTLAQQSLTCHFASGPRAGSTIDFTGVQGANPGPIGSPCQDGLGSGGILVAPNGSSSPSVQTNAGSLPNISATCQFTAGPRTGQIIDFQGVPGARPGPMGLPCQDGMGSTGIIVAPSTPGTQQFAQMAQQMPNLSYVCAFTSGPLAGQRRNFQGVLGAQPGPVGAPCNDGISSVGTIVP